MVNYDPWHPKMHMSDFEWLEVVKIIMIMLKFGQNQIHNSHEVNSNPFLGGLSLHLNLNTRDLETYSRTYSGHF